MSNLPSWVLVKVQLEAYSDMVRQSTAPVAMQLEAYRYMATQSMAALHCLKAHGIFLGCKPTLFSLFIDEIYHFLSCWDSTSTLVQYWLDFEPSPIIELNSTFLFTELYEW